MSLSSMEQFKPFSAKIQRSQVYVETLPLKLPHSQRRKWRKMITYGSKISGIFPKVPYIFTLIVSSFLDVLVFRQSNGTIDRTIFRKQTNSLYINWESVCTRYYPAKKKRDKSFVILDIDLQRQCLDKDFVAQRWNNELGWLLGALVV